VYGDERPSKIIQDYDRQPFLPDKEQWVQEHVPWQKPKHRSIRTLQISNNDLCNHLDDILQCHGVTPPRGPIPTTPNQEEEEEIDLELFIQEGGGRLNNFLFELAQKIQTPIQFKDLAQLPAEARKKWIEACLEELKVL
jgi:hypothetical protein